MDWEPRNPRYLSFTSLPVGWRLAIVDRESGKLIRIEDCIGVALLEFFEDREIRQQLEPVRCLKDVALIVECDGMRREVVFGPYGPRWSDDDVRHHVGEQKVAEWPLPGGGGGDIQ